MNVYSTLLSFLVILLVTINNVSAAGKPQHNKVVTCYVASWASYRESNGKFGINNLQPQLCTHLIYSFAGLNISTWSIQSLDPYKDIENGTGDYKRFTALRDKYSNVKTISLAIGGWNENATNYSDLAFDPDRRKKFIESVVRFLKKFNFNGFDLDWEYPADSSRGGRPEDKENFVHLVKELKEEFDNYGYSLTAAITANKAMLDNGYNIPEISKYLDHIHVMAYDYHGAWDKKVLPNSPLNSKDGADVESTIKHLLSKGAPPNKLILGVPMYGRTFILSQKLSPDESPINKQSSNGFPGPYSKQDGFMGYNEICEEIITNPHEWNTGWDADSSTPYAVKGDHAVTYDDQRSIKKKAEYAMKMNLGGIMIWSIDTDDFLGNCKKWKEYSDQSNPTFPLMRAINMVLANTTGQEAPHKENDKTNSSNCFHLNLTLILFALLARYTW